MAHRTISVARLWAFGAEFSIELKQSFDALKSIEAPRPNFRYYLIFECRFLDTTFYGFEVLTRITQV